MITIVPIRALKDNYIWMMTASNKNAWVVDPGDAAPVIDALEKNGLTLASILITHHHHDHSGGLIDLINYAGNIPVYGSHASPIKHITHHVKDNDKISCASTQFRVIEIPGHTLDHIAYYGDNALFCGDTLFSVGCGRIFEGTPTQMHNSLTKLTNLPDNTKIYCGHEYTAANLKFAHHVDPDNKNILAKMTQAHDLLNTTGCTLPSLLAEEKKTNPFLRCHEKTIIDSVEKYVKRKLTNTVETFACLREWKNNF